MSSERDVHQDRMATRQVLTGDRPIANGTKNWLDHDLNSGAAKTDEMLLMGATREQMESARGAVDQHIRHLREIHGLPITEAANLWAFDRLALEVADDDGPEPPPNAPDRQQTAQGPPNGPDYLRVDMPSLPPPQPVPPPDGTVISPSTNRADRLHTINLVLQIVVAALGIIAAIIALIWRSK